MKFKEFIAEASVVKSFDIGKGRDKSKVEIKKEGSKFVAYVDGDKLDAFRSAKDAEEGVRDFAKLMGR
jgi:hypothetical protein